MISNMQLEDVLTILGRVGTVQLRKGTNDRSATPGHVADTKGWTCELTIAGYLRPYGHGGSGGSQLRVGSSGRGSTSLEAALSTLSELEAFLQSDDAAVCRACYVRDWEGQVYRSGPRPADVPVYQWDRSSRHPGDLKPEARLDYGD